MSTVVLKKRRPTREVLKRIPRNVLHGVLQTIVANLRGKTRLETLNGRKYIVAPLSMITHGVLNGSQGPLYYPPEEISRDPSAWNHMPIVVQHPEVNGKPVSARTPGVLEKQQIGYVFNATYSDKLIAEGWFDVEKTSRVDRSIITNLKAGKAIELSTGLFTDNEPKRGVHNGRRFDFIARNYRPDHLAILPDRRGACSVEDGCGVLVNSDSSSNGRPIMAKAKLTTNERSALIDTICTNCECAKEDRDALGKLSDPALSKMAEDSEVVEGVANAVAEVYDGAEPLTVNAMPDFIKQRMAGKGGKPTGKQPVDAEDEEEPDDDDLPAQNAAKPKTTEEWLRASNAPAEVVQLVRNAACQEQANKAKLIKAIIANENNVLTKEVLETLKPEVLKGMAAVAVNSRRSNYAGAAAPLTVANVADDEEEPLMPPTINWEEEAAAARKTG